MKKLFYLSTCSSCINILKAITVPTDVQLIDLKKQMFTAEDLNEMFCRSGSYEALFNKRSQKFISSGLKNNSLSDVDYGMLLPTDYTFLKRPVLIYENRIFIGNGIQNIRALTEFLPKKKDI